MWTRENVKAILQWESEWYWDSNFLGRLIRSLGVPKEREVWNSQGGIKDKRFFPLHSLGLYNNNVSCLRRRRWHPTPVLLPGESDGWRSLVGCSPWGPEESETTEWLPFHFSCIGEGNGNPRQWSCLENPRDGGVWWAAICGSRTQLKQHPACGQSLEKTFRLILLS